MRLLLSCAILVPHTYAVHLCAHMEIYFWGVSLQRVA
jgi:hypothetical protein